MDLLLNCNYNVNVAERGVVLSDQRAKQFSLNSLSVIGVARTFVDLVRVSLTAL